MTAARPVVRLAKVSSRLCLNANILVERVEPIAAYDPSRSHADGHEAPHEDDEEDAEVCERCLAWCPVPGALTIVPESGSVIPKVDAARCTGCGECVSHCAAYPGALTLVTVTTQ